MGGSYVEFLLILGLWWVRIGFGSSLQNSTVRCIEKERQALLQFKQGLQDDQHLLSSWSNQEDCCKWKGITCSHQTGYVVTLDLGCHYWSLKGEISHSLLGLQHLTYLGLSCCDFSNKPFPAFIGSFTKLQYLNLSLTEIIGTIPQQIGNLTHLISLDLSWTNLIEDHNLDWLLNMSSLRHLDLSRINLSKAIDWPDKVSVLPSLTELHLIGCELQVPISPKLPNVSSSSPLSILSLNLNNVSSSIFPWLFKYNSTLVSLDLSMNMLQGFIPKGFRNLHNLRVLDLSSNEICGEISNLLELSSLRELHLSYNSLNGSLTKGFRNLHNLQVLDLSSNEICGEITNFLELSSLRELHLSYNSLNGSLTKGFGNLHNLRVLDLSGNEICGEISNLLKLSSSLRELHLSYNSLNGSLTKGFGNLHNLQVLDLSGNEICGEITNISKLSSLRELHLSNNRLNESLTKGFGNFHNLQVLDLSNNEICGEITNLSKLSSLRELYLSNNSLNGSLTKGLEKLFKLNVIDVAFNSFEGVLTEAHLSNFSALKHLDLSYNSLSLSFSPNWIPPFQLKVIGLGSCKMGIAFPQWLQTQKKFELLDISYAGILDSIPNWFWNLSSSITSLNLSHNQINGVIPFPWFWRFSFIGIVDLSYNHFSGLLPQINPLLVAAFLSNNQFHGSISSFCPKNKSELDFISTIDISYNFLYGKLPECLANHSNLFVLNLEENNFSRRNTKFIERMCSHPSLRVLHLLRNNLSGELSPIMNCSLDTLDLGENKLSGRIPIFKKAYQSSMKILSLRSNLFSGSIPLQLCNLEVLQILDLSQNKITGSIPKCLNNFTVLAQSSYKEYPSFLFSDSFFVYYDYLLVTLKDIRLKYTTNLGLLGFIDLSNNELNGEIPIEITSLLGLVGLNLSGNHLIGTMPQRIGDMKALESLDLSGNHLSGNIPQSLSTLTFLSHLNLSNNNFSGRIPTSTQLQSLNASAYGGNPYLCGLPLMERCLEDKVVQGPQIGGKHGQGNTQDHVNFYEHLGFCSSIIIGFTIGFWGVCGMLLLKSSWRHAYFQCLEHIGDKFYIAIVIFKAMLL